MSWLGAGMIIEEIYDALIEAGASETKARAAAEFLCGYPLDFDEVLDRKASKLRR